MTNQVGNQESNFVIKLSNYPRVFSDTPFWKELINYYANPSGMNKAEFNLICSKRDIGLWTKIQMKPHRGWKVSDVKKYFGISGKGESLLNDFMEVWEEYQQLKEKIKLGNESGKDIQLTQ